MNDICHPAFYYIGHLGCKDRSKITTAFYTYIELCEVKRLWDVKYCYNEKLDLIFLTGKKTRNSTDEIYIPWLIHNSITITEIEQIQEQLNTEKFTLVIRSGDNTSVYYTITEGLVKPVTPEVANQVKEKLQNKHELEEEIRQSTSTLCDMAKMLNTDKFIR